MSQSFITIYQSSGKHLYSEINSEAVILDTNSGTYFGLNDVSNQIWQWLQQPISEQKLLEQLLEAYEVSEQVAKSDLAQLLQQMLQAGLIEMVSQEITQIAG